MRDRPVDILLVDDDEDIRTIAVIAFQLDPMFQVRAARSGDEAVALLREGTSRPDVLVLDMMMPGLSGAALVAAIRALPEVRSIPVVLMTARIGPDGQAAPLPDIAGVIPKPFDPLRLPDLLRAILDRHDAGA